MPEQNLPVIPRNITVHLGAPNAPARNVTVPFVEYIKNVASSEIYPTWPENALRANIYAIISYALNRVYTEYYRSRGYDFDITNSTQYDQAFVENREIYENISDIVDDIFNNYVVRTGSVAPYFTQFCNGTTSTCNGLSQWGTVPLAERGLDPLQILRNFYGNDIEIVQNAAVEDVSESYPGVPLRIGETGNNVKIIQTELNRIARNYPAIPKIAEENGIFGVDTENAVREFQRIFGLPVTGQVDKATWYRIKQYYTGVKSLSDLISEGVTLEESQVPFAGRLAEGMRGEEIRILQYYLNVIAYFNPDLNLSPLDGVFGAATAAAVRDFQAFYGLPVTGIVDAPTWNILTKIYADTVASLPEGYAGNRAKLYPGYFLTEGMQGENIRDLQTYLSLIGRYYNDLPELPVTGYFGAQTHAAVETFQRLFGLPVNGAVGPITWYTIANQYDYLIETEGLG